MRVDGYDYVGLGNSTNKKDSANNAAKDFLLYLVRNGVLTEGELPFNTIINTGNEPANQMATPSNTFAPLRPPGPHMAPMPPMPRPPMMNPNFMPVPQNTGPRQEYIDRIAQKRKFEEAEELDINSGIHGNWTLENSKKELHEFLQKNKLQANYKYNPVGPDHNRYELMVFAVKNTSDCDYIQPI